MSDRHIFDRYLLALRETAIDDKTEHTDRTALQALLRAVAETCETAVTAQHEPKRVADKGAPDFKIARAGLIVGYVENKAIGENLDRVLKSDQLTRYKSLSHPCATPPTSKAPGFGCTRIASSEIIPLTTVALLKAAARSFQI